MASASSPEAAPAGSPRAPRTALARVLPPLALALGTAVLLRVAFDPWYLNYDARYALLWARDLWEGYTPEYRADFAPTPHPLQMALGSLALPFGSEGAAEVMLWAVLACFGLVAWLVYRLGATLFSPWVGAVAAAVVLTRPAMLRDALLAYQDVPFAALVVAAVILEARQARRGAPVLALLAVAGLLRPEAWVLAGLYWLYLWPALDGRRRALLAGLVALAPVVWAVSDWLVTGDLLHSLHGTSALAEEAGRRRHLHQVPYWTAQYFGYTLREPLVIGVPVGLAFAWLYRRQRSALPLAVAAVMVAVFAIGPLFGLPLIGRYVRTPSALLAVFYGLAVFGWMLLPAGRGRERWRIAGLACLALSVLWLPWHARMIGALERRLDNHGALYADLRAAAQAPAVRRAFAACRPLTAADHRPIPYLRWWLDGPPGSVGTVESGASPLGRVLLVPRRSPLVLRFYRENFPSGVRPPPGYERVYANRSYAVWTAPGCPG